MRREVRGVPPFGPELTMILLGAVAMTVWLMVITEMWFS